MTPPSNEAKADQPSRAYRVLSRIPGETWDDHGEHPGTSPDVAIKRAEAKHPALKAENLEIVAPPASSFRILERKVEMVESVSYKPKQAEAPKAKPSDPNKAPVNRAAAQEALDAGSE